MGGALADLKCMGATASTQYCWPCEEDIGLTDYVDPKDIAKQTILHFLSLHSGSLWAVTVPQPRSQSRDLAPMPTLHAYRPLYSP